MFTPRTAVRLAGTILLAAASALLPACSKGSDSADKEKGTTVAVVNGVKIGEDEVGKLVQVMRQQNFIPPDSTTTGSTPEEKQRFFAIDRLIDRALVLQDAARQKIAPPAADIDQRLQQFKTQAGAGDSLPAGMNEAELRRNLADDLTINEYFEKSVIEPIQVSDTEVQEYFTGHPEQFGGQDQVRARHILIRLDPAATDQQKAEARQKAQEVLDQAKKGQDFAELARKHSQDPGSGPNGGDLGFFGRGQMVKPFEDAAFGLESGQVSGLVESQFGYHIIKVEEKKAAEPLQLDAIRHQLEQFLKSQKVQSAVEARLASLKAGAKIVRKDSTPGKD